MSAYDDAIIRRLQEARIEGEPVTLSEIKQLGGLYWEDCWRRVRKNQVVGEKPNEQGEPCFELAVEPVSTEALPSGDQSSRSEAGLPRPVRDQAGDSASVDTQLTLLPSSVSPYDTEREAA